MTILGYIKRQVFRIYRPYKDLRREIWKNPTRDIRATVDEPKIIFDIGANVGQTAVVYSSEFTSADIYSFEPFAPAFEHLKRLADENSRIHVYPLAISDHVGNETLYISEANVLNSILPPSTERQNQFIDKRITINTTTIDIFCEQNNIHNIDLLKIDTQGSELKVLRGAENYLRQKKISLIYLELNYVDFYEGQAKWWEIPQYLNDWGFHLFDLYYTVYGKNGHARWCDALFCLSPQNSSSGPTLL